MAVVSFPCIGHGCTCKAFNPGGYSGIWHTCADCGHTEQTHASRAKGENERAAIENAAERAANPEPVTKVTYSTVTDKPVDTDIPVSELRAALKRNGERVGERGRLDPKQKALGAKLISEGK